MIEGLKLYPKYKDSGPWLGEVPAHREVVPLKWVARRFKSGATPPTSEPSFYENGSIPWYGPSSCGESEAAAVERADLLLTLGTSLEVYPVAGLVPQAAHARAKVAIINRDPTPFDHLADLVIHSELGPVMELLRRELGLEGEAA